MSYNITLSGHTNNPHNEAVKEIAEEAYRKLKALHNPDEAPPSLTGWSGDNSGSITLAPPSE